VIQKNITIIDYGMGNLWSVQSAIKYLGGTSIISSDPEKVLQSPFLILPGVGSFHKAMVTLRETGLNQAIIEAVRKKGSKILGICLGMQLLGSYGTEDGDTEGLSLIPNRVDKFTSQEVKNNKIPHIGFNGVEVNQRKGLFLNLSVKTDFYFVHSYKMLKENLNGRIGICNYGIDFLAAFEFENVCGTQFHPEKSQTNGLLLLNNFLS